MKFLLILISFLALEIKAQDLIILRNGDEVQSKVLEISTLEIKYKRFDNPEGPIYTIEKSEVFLIKYQNGTKDVFNEDRLKSEPKVVDSNLNSRVYFLRKTPSASSLIGYEIFIDEKSICKLNNNMYTVHEVLPGKHIFSVQFFGRTLKEKAEKLKVDILPGKTYFIEVTQNSKIYEPDTYCVLMSEVAGNYLLDKLVEDEDCE